MEVNYGNHSGVRPAEAHRSTAGTGGGERNASRPQLRRFGLVIGLSLTLALTGCSNQSVDPVAPSRELSMLCIDTAEKVGDNYADEVEAILAEMGIASRMTGGAFSGECVHRLKTRVVWANALIPYIISLELIISEDGRTLGDASYSVGQAYRTPERFGSAASKAKPLLKELLAEYERPID